MVSYFLSIVCLSACLFICLSFCDALSLLAGLFLSLSLSLCLCGVCGWVGGCVSRWVFMGVEGMSL